MRTGRIDHLAVYRLSPNAKPPAYKRPARGLGDWIEQMLGPFGRWYKRKHKRIFKKPCRCAKRRDNLNELFPFKNR
jgi:hypothetical protein